MRKNKHKLYVETIGPSFAPRYRIVHKDRGFWDGKAWQTDPRKGLLYYWFEETARVVRNIEMAENVNKPIKKYTATVTIEVIGENPIDKQELIEYLAKEAKLLISTPNPKDSVVHLQIDWSTLKDEKDSSKKGADERIAGAADDGSE